MAVLFNVRTRLPTVSSAPPPDAAQSRTFAELRTATGWRSLPMRVLRTGTRQLELQKAASEAIGRVVMDKTPAAAAIARGSDARRTFQKIGEKIDKTQWSTKSLDECRKEINVIGKKIESLEAERERYIQQQLISKEKIKGSKSPLYRTRAAIDLKGALETYRSGAIAITPAGMDLAIRALLVPLAAGPNLAEKQAIHAQFAGVAAMGGLPATALSKLFADATARSAALQFAGQPFHGNAAGADAHAAREMLDQALALADNIYKEANDTFIDKLSYGLKNIKTQIDGLHEELMTVQSQTLQCLCFGSKINYSTDTNWATYYGSVTDLYNKTADKYTRRLDDVSASLGLPVLRDERREASMTKKIKDELSWRKHPFRNPAATAIGFGGVGSWAFGLGSTTTGWMSAVGAVTGIGLTILGGAAVTVAVGTLFYGFSKLYGQDDDNF